MDELMNEYPDEVSKNTVSISGHRRRLVWAMAFSNSKSEGLRKPRSMNFTPIERQKSTVIPS